MTSSKMLEGEFFISTNPSNRQTGVLDIEKDGKSRLKIFGSFNTPSPATDHSTYTIWGQLFNGDAISLLECSRKQKTTTFGVAETETYSASYVLSGCLVADRETPFFNTLSAEIDGLREWINIDGGQFSFKTDGSAFDYKYEDPAPIKFPVSDLLDGEIYFRNEVWIGLEYKNQSEQKTRVHLESKTKTDLRTLMLSVRNFRNLVSLFIGQKVKITKIMLTSSEAHVKLINPTRVEEPVLKDIMLFYNDTEAYGNLADRLVHFVKFEDISPDFGLMVSRWMEFINSPLAPITELLIDAITDHSYFEENDFLKAWQGVEAFHRIILQDTEALKKNFNNWFEKIKSMITDAKLLKKLDGKMTYGYEMPAPNRLMELLKANSTVLHLDVSPKQMDFWIKEMSNTRNYLTHFEPAMSEKKAALQHVVYYRSLLKAILVVLILRHLGVREELLGVVTKNSVFYYYPLKKIGID